MAFFDVIKYEGGNDVLVWKHPREDFNTSSKLIVHETQEAVLYEDGRLKEVYAAGKHDIKTENLPFLTRMGTLLTGGLVANHYEVYFVNKAHVMRVYWGTSKSMQIQDPVYQVPFDITAYGQFSVSVQDSCKLLTKLVGTESKLDADTLEDIFSAALMVQIKDYISNIMLEEELSFLEINSYLMEISNNIKKRLSVVLAEYGLFLEDFIAESISIVKDDQYEQLRQSLTNRGKQRIEGYTYGTERAFDVAQKQAENTGAGGAMMNAGIGMGAGVVGGQMMGSLMRNTVAAPVMQASGTSGVQPDDEFARVRPTRRRRLAQEKDPAEVEKETTPPNEGGQMIVGYGSHQPLAEDSRFKMNVPAYMRKQQSGQEKKYCPNCSEEVKAQWKLCPYCGEKLMSE